MVERAVAETYTYYHPDGRIEVVEDAPLHGHGRAWARGKYVPPIFPGPLNVRVGEAGIHVWRAIQWLRSSNNRKDEVLARYGHVLHAEDLVAAISYYKKYKDEIDEKLAEDMPV